MAIFEITAPDGRQLEIEGDTPPTEQDLDKIFANLPSDNSGNIKHKGIDLSPSGLVKQATAGIAAPIRALRFGETLPQAYNRAREIQEESILNKFSPAVDIGAYTALPISRAGGAAGFVTNAAVQGGVPMALEALKQGENPLAGAAGGTAIGIGIQSLPYVGKGAGLLTNKLYLNSFPGLKEKTVQQLIKPNSKALDLTEDTAQNLLMNTTERIQNAYNNLLNKRGQAVNDAVESLRGSKYRIPVQDLQQDITQTFDQYGGDLINPARNMTGGLEDNLNDLIVSGGKETPLQGISGATDITETTISPIDLEKSKQQIGNMINWADETARNYQNPILEQIYGKFNNRLSQLSPELQTANEEFANLRAFKKNEGLRRILKPGDNIDSASQALKNYNSTVTKGNTGRNIRDLENVLSKEGEKPFLNDIDDVNAAMDLLKTEPTGINPLGITDKLKNLVERPILLGSRSLNKTIQRSGLPEVYTRLKQNISEPVRRLTTPLTVKTVSPILYGGVSNLDEEY